MLFLCSVVIIFILTTNTHSQENMLIGKAILVVVLAAVSACLTINKRDGSGWGVLAFLVDYFNWICYGPCYERFQAK